MWFAVAIFFNIKNPIADQLALSLAGMRYKTQTECIAGGRQQTSGMAAIHIHGKFACMYHNEPDAEMRHAVTVTF